MKIKNWYNKHKTTINKIVDIILTIWIFFAGVIIGSRYPQCSNIVSADEVSNYYIPSVTLTSVELDNDINIVPIIASNNGLPQENYVIAPHSVYYVEDLYIDIEHAVRNTDPSQHFNLYLAGTMSQGEFSTLSFYIDSFVTTNINQSTIGNLFYFFSDINVTCTVQYSLFNFNTGLFDDFLVNVTPTDLGDGLYDYSFRLTSTENYIYNQLALIRGLSISIFDFSPMYNPFFEFHLNSYSPQGAFTEIITSLPSIEIERVEVSTNVFGTIIESVDGFLSIEILPDLSFYDILIIVVTIPLCIAILKIWLGG